MRKARLILQYRPYYLILVCGQKNRQFLNMEIPARKLRQAYIILWLKDLNKISTVMSGEYGLKLEGTSRVGITGPVRPVR